MSMLAPKFADSAVESIKNEKQKCSIEAIHFFLCLTSIALCNTHIVFKQRQRKLEWRRGGQERCVVQNVWSKWQFKKHSTQTILRAEDTISQTMG